jgi:peptidoglycan/LPS O-acetylase OafA/YrhL
LWVSQILTVLVVGIWFTNERPPAFFSQWDTWHFLIKNCTLFHDVVLTLPGAFETAPYRAGGVNASLWTLPIELRMYVYLGMGWLTLRLLREAGDRAFIILCTGIAVFGVSLDLAHFISPLTRWFSAGPSWTLIGLFFSGAALRLLQNKVVVSKTFALCMTLSLLVSTVNPLFFGIVYRLTLAYLVVYVALVASFGRYRFSPRGDYSYGIYIYACPIQQAIATTLRGISPIQMVALSFVITFAFAFGSWHLIENHALRMKERLVSKTPRVFAPRRRL